MTYRRLPIGNRSFVTIDTKILRIVGANYRNSVQGIQCFQNYSNQCVILFQIKIRMFETVGTKRFNRTSKIKHSNEYSVVYKTPRETVYFRPL